MARYPSLQPLLLAALLALPAAALAQSADVERVNGSITAEAGARHGRLETVNGGIRIGDSARTGAASTVNGGITLGNDVATGALSTVNGGIRAGERARIGGDVETVNGGVLLRRGGEVQGDVRTVNGAIGLVATVVEGDVGTASGDVTVGIGSHVRGGLRVEKAGATWMPIRLHTRRQRVVIGPGAVVEGPLVFERDVLLYVHDSARTGPVTGAEVRRYSTPTAPPRGADD